MLSRLEHRLFTSEFCLEPDLRGSSVEPFLLKHWDKPSGIDLRAFCVSTER